MCDNSIVALHTHTDKSNFRLLDSINSVKELITTAVELNHTGLAITDHESISAHVEAIQVTNKLKQEGKIPQDFKLILGNEIYLVDSLEEVRDNYVGGGVTKFPHFLLLAKNKSGHEALRKLSSIAWSENHFTTGKMHRTPTLKSQLADMVKEYPNTLIATTACLGSESSIHILGMKEAQENEDDELVQFHRGKLMEFFHWCIKTFGKDHFFIELQPARSEEQIYVNERLVMLSAFYGLKCVMATDAHYLRPEQQLAHEAFLNAQDGEREVAAFYSDTYLHTIEEIYEKTSYLPREVVEDAIKNTVMIGEMIENYTIEKDVQIPTVPIPEFELKHRFRNFYTEFPYISKMAHSDNEQDRFMIHCLEEGFMKYIPYRTISEKRKHELIERINLELGEMWEISQVINQSVASYYITVKDIVDLIWDDDCGGNSLVGAGRGSAGGFLTCMLLGITQINPLDYGVEMPHWRHLHRSRPDVNRLDIDIDTEGTKRERIIYALKRKYGEHNIIQVSTQTKVGSKSAINTACRGLGIDAATAGYISGLIPWERGENWTLTECLEGNEENGRKAIPEFIKEIEAYPRLKETALAIEGKVTQRSIHAGGVILFNEPYYKSNALMRAPNGNLITQFNLDDSQAVGNMKFDLLTIEALDKIRATLELLIEYGEIEKQGNLRETFNHYFHPERLELNDPRVYELVSAGNISDLFQFNTEVGKSAVVKTAPTNLVELASANSLMRLLSDSGQQPIDTFTHYKEDIKRWYTDMTAFGLNEAEQKIMEKHLLIFNGVADTQESIMLLTMDEEIAGFTVEMANDLRSAVANFLSTSAREKLEKLRKDFFSMGKERGTREVLLHYVWDVQIRRQLKYSFSILHTVSYTVIAIIEAFLNIHFNPLYWQTACLIANSYGQEDEEYDEEEDFGFESNKNNSRRYDKLSIAISNMQQEGVVVSLPDINQSSYSFTPIIEEGRIVYGLNGIVGVGEEVVNTLMSLRPFTDFDDFYQRAVVPKLVPNKAVIQLIKSGAFNSFGDRKQIMEKYRYYQNPPRKSLNMQNYTMMTRLKLDTDEHLAHEHQLVRFRNYITQKQFVIEKREKPKDEIIQLDRIAQPFYEDHFVDLGVVQINDGCYAISKSAFEKEYQKRIEPLRKWLKDSETIKQTNKALEREWYIDNADESLQRWEMLSVGFYSDQHEIASVDKEEYEIVDFKELPRNPVVSSTYIDQRGRTREIYKLERIAGVVVGKTKNSNMVHLMTESGIVNVKLYGNMFSKYDRRIMEAVSEDKNRIVEHSWFTRGNRLIFTGVRRGDRFMPRVYKNHRFQSPVILINRINDDGSLITQTERYSP